MSDLRQLQQRFQRYVLRGTGDIAPHIAGAETASERLAIYAEAYRLRLMEALETDFVGLRAALDPAEFAAMAHAYIDTYPSTHPSLRHYGGALAAFLARDDRYRGRPLLAELAAFDWALTDAFDAPDAAVLTLDTLAALAPERWGGMRLQPHPSLVRLDLYWNAPAIWKAADSAAPLPVAERSERAIAWAVWRQELQTYFRSLPPAEAWALDAVRGGRDFAAVCEGLCEWVDPDDAAVHAAGLLKQWIHDGMLRDIAPD